MALTVTTNAGLNMRSGAGTENSRIGGVEAGTSYEVLDVKKDSNGVDWYKIGDGYVCGSYCTVSNDGGDGSTATQTLAEALGDGLGTDITGVNGQVEGEVWGQGTIGTTGIESALESMLGLSQTDEQVAKFYKRRVFGTPYQYLDTTDIRPNGGNVGRIFGNNILGESPILSLLPCKPNYLPSLSEEKKQDIFKSLMTNASELATEAEKAVADETIGSIETKYFTTDIDAVEYNKYVNTLLRACAIFMGLGNSTVPGTTKLYSEYNWSNWHLSNIFDNSSLNNDPGGILQQAGKIIKDVKDAIDNPSEAAMDVMKAISTDQYYVDFYVSPSTSYSESMSNRAEDSAFKGLVSKGEGMVKELAFLLGANALNAETMEQSMANMSKEMQSELQKFNLTKGDNVLSRLLSNSQLVITGSNIVFPQIYHESEYSKSYRCELKLVSPYGDRESIFLNIIVPMIHMLCFVLPRQTSANSYSSPFLIKGHISKWFSCEMGLVQSVDIQKEAFSADGFPTQVTMSISLQDLYSALSISKTDSIKSAIMFLQNQSLIEYMSVICGLNLKSSEWQMKENLVKAIVSNAAQDAIDNSAAEARQDAARAAARIFQNVTGGRF